MMIYPEQLTSQPDIFSSSEVSFYASIKAADV